MSKLILRKTNLTPGIYEIDNNIFLVAIGPDDICREIIWCDNDHNIELEEEDIVLENVSIENREYNYSSSDDIKIEIVKIEPMKI